GPARGRDRLRRPAGPVRRHPAGGAGRVAALAAEHAHPQPGGPPRAAGPCRGGRVGWWYTGPMGRLTEIDPGVTVADLAALAAELADRGLRPAVAWSTHPHWDHVLWSAGLGDAPRYIA